MTCPPSLVAACAQVLHLVKFPQAVCRILCIYKLLVRNIIMYTLTHGRTYGQPKTECLRQLIASDGIKTEPNKTEVWFRGLVYAIRP